ncbi:Heat shock 70 kDa protein cognate 1 [Orchesella cincta]|uniref:Heat shock 70 kDa protein cognate 1 n=1 Tax=Orchesella cincta TaxID=48709 RepID=A0A1D2MJK3_ORCCI|nr:Heat shock 70 kDa protein cognate 1 [Orchesella cincta]
MDKRFKSAKKVLIYDLGGGTFDVAVIDVESGINVLAIGGHKHLGGEDFDRRLMGYCVKEFSAKTKIKILTGNGKNGMQGLDERTVHRLRRLQARKEDIDDVILIGGSTRIPRVRHLLKEYFGGKKALNIAINPDEAVAYGAARQAAILNGADAKGQLDLTIQDKTPLSLGTQIVTKEMSIIVPRHTKIPCKHQSVYHTSYWKFTLSGLPPRTGRSESVDIGMDIDSMGILHVTAVSKSISGVRGELTISEESQRIPRAQLPKLREESLKMLMEA